jgi:hypothetical protein
MPDHAYGIIYMDTQKVLHLLSKEIEKTMDYKPMVATSGEIFYTVNGNLHMAKSMEEYQTVLDRKAKLESTYFELTVNGENVKLLATRTHAIMNLILQLPDLKMNHELNRYQKTLKEIEKYGYIAR